MIIRLVPKIFFDRMEDGLDLFVNCLGFTVLHRDDSLAVVGRDVRGRMSSKVKSTPRGSTGDSNRN